ncbi:MSHA biogenesis protein MshQ [Vibrio mimicus]
MNKWLSRAVIGFFAVLSANALAFQSIDNSIYFPSVVQGHGSCSGAPNPQFTQYNQAKITGTGGSPLEFCSSNLGSGLPTDGCDGQQCVITGTASIPSLSLVGSNSFQFSSNNNTEMSSCTSGQEYTFNSQNIGSITAYQGCTINIKSSNGLAKIKQLEVGNAIVRFTAGDYWIENLILNSNSIIEIEGDVRIFSYNDISLNSSIANSTSQGNLTMVAYKSFNMTSSSQINGYIYINDEIILNNNSKINGRVTARKLTMNSSTQINQNQQQGLTCFEDDFNRTSLGQNWVPFTSTGSFIPSIVSSRMRLTEALNNEATAATYQRIFPAAGNVVTVEFDYYAWANLSGVGADGVAVIFSDATITPKTGGFGGSLGYAPRTDSTPIKPGFAGGWLGIGLDEYGNFSNPTEGRTGGPGFRAQAVALRGSESASYRYLTGTGANLSPKLDVRNTSTAGPGHRYKLTIDSRSSGAVWVRVDRTYNGTQQTLIDWYNVLNASGQSAAPEDLLLSLAGSTGSSVNNHEIDNFRVCALKSRPVEPQVDHFRFTLPQQGLTCSASDVTIQACANESCSQLYTNPVTATLSPDSTPSATGGWVGGSHVTFTNGIATTQLRRNTAGKVTVNVIGSTPSSKPYQVNLCSYTSSPGNYSTANCTVNFADSGFIVDVPHAYANQTVTGSIKAVRKDNASQQCLPSFQNVQKSVSFWSDYLTPNSSDAGFSAYTVSVNGTGIGQAANVATPLNLSFNQNGAANFTVAYRDAGNLALNARFTGSGNEQDLRLEGQGTFIRVPRALVLSAKNFYSSDGKCPSADLSCAVFARADEAFELNIRAVVAEPNEDNDFTNNLTAYNYQQQNIALQHSLVQPTTGVAGDLDTESYHHELGATTTVRQKVSEVGVFDFSLVAPSSYLGLNLAAANLPIAVVSTGSIGRFIPAYFAVSPMTVTLDAACKTNNAFTYLGQPFGYTNSPGLYLRPKSANDADTKNYLIEPWWRYTNQWDGRTYSDTVNGVSLGFTNTLAFPVSRQATSNSGIVLSGESVWYEKPLQPKAVFNSEFDLVLNASNLMDQDNVCYRQNATSDCQGFTFTQIDRTMPLYWGKLVIQDVYGPETQPLEQPIYVEHYTSNGFVRTTDDSCTSLPSISNFALQSTDYDVTTTGVPVPPQVLAGLTSSNLSQGKSAIRFSAPGAGITGYIDSILNLNTHDLMWLAEDKDSDGSFDQTTQGRAQFGLYRGSDRVIWWRESN